MPSIEQEGGVNIKALIALGKTIAKPLVTTATKTIKRLPSPRRPPTLPQKRKRRLALPRRPPKKRLSKAPPRLKPTPSFV